MVENESRRDERELSARLARDLHLLTLICERWVATWDLLPDRLRRTAEAAQKKSQGGDGGLKQRAAKIFALVEPLVRPAGDFSLVPARLIPLAVAVEELEAGERHETDHDQEGSLYTTLHVLKNALLALRASVAVTVASRCLDTCRELPSTLMVQPGVALEHVRQAFHGEDVLAMRQAAASLQQACDAYAERLPPVPRISDAAGEGGAACSCLIVAVEDLPEWRLTIRKVVEEARRQLGTSFELGYEEHADAASARAALDRAFRAAARDGPRPLLVLDLGLPCDPTRGVAYTTGRDLLNYSREKLNLPVIVLTTPHHFLDDHLRAFQLGVVDYFLKGAQPEAGDASERDLLDAILRAVTPHPVRTLDVSEDGSRTVRIDDLEFCLDPMPFTVLAVAARHRRGDHCLPVTVRMVEDELRDEFDMQCQDIQKTVYNLRAGVTEAFASAGRTIHPSEELLANTRRGNEFAYRVVARVMNPQREPETARRQAPTRILIVEDELEVWQKPVVRLLERYGYQVKAADSRSGAITLLESFEPDILCLDMAIPDAPGGDPVQENGLAVLREAKEFLPDVRAVALTSLADDDLLRSAANRLEVRPDDFVRKRLRFDEMAVELVLKLWRAELEIERQARLPLPDLPHLPYLRLRVRRSAAEEESLAEIKVFSKSWQPTENEGKLLLLLAHNPGRSVSKEQIYDAIWPPQDMDDLDSEDVDLPNALRSLIRRLRQRIAREWFGITDRGLAKEVSTAVLANDGKQSYMLNARIDWEGSAAPASGG